MTQGAHIPQEDLILYAMQTLPAEELAQVRAHLSACEECRAELANAHGDLGLVALSVEQQPLPEGARQRFLDRIATSADLARKAARPSVVPIDTKRPTRRTAVLIPWLAAAALLLVAISLKLRVNSLHDELTRQHELAARQASENAQAKEALELLTSHSAKHVLLTANMPKPAPTGRAVYLAESGALIFQANNLEKLAESKTYELWVIPASGQAPIPAGLFRPDAEGSASVVLPPLPKGIPAKAFGVTIEKAEGSTTPTLPIVLSGAVSTSGE
jgi:Anti-sigma-K factor rskA/Putative zinc-finger